MGEKIKSLTKKQKIVFLTAGIAAIVIIIVICSIVVVDHNKIDLANVYTVKVEGIDTQGMAKCQINEKSLETILIGKNVDAIKGNILLESMKCNLSKTDNLKNGDKITVTITYDETVANQLNLSFKNTRKEVEVSGLAKGKEVDVFKDLKVTYTGTSPDGKVSLINNSSDPFISIVTFKSSKDKVANGDRIIVEAIYPDRDAIAHKALVKETKKSYSVSGLPEYISKANQIDKKALSDIRSMSDKLIEEKLQIKTSIPSFINHLSNLNTAPDFTFGENYSYKNIQLQKAYLYTLKNNTDVYASYFKHNAAITISSVDIIANGKSVGTAYMTAEIKDAIINNGKINGTQENCGQYNSFEEAQQAAENYYGSSDYNVEAIDIK